MKRGAGWLVLLIILTAGCSGDPRVPVADRSRPESVRIANEYTVRQGDTLYSIAWRYGLDYRALASMNQIDSRYQIFPGQKLRLKPTSIARTSKPQISKNGVPVGSRSDTKIVTQRTVTKKTTASPVKKPPVLPKKTTASNTVAPEKPRLLPPALPSGPIIWRWPGHGQVIAAFKTRGKVNKGINLAGRRSDPVFAAAAGRVVFAGSGLLGYGNLLIIEHSPEFLSAYAHNSRVLVKESDKVQVGDKIAEMGSSGADRVMLHFEIRRDGNPVNPLKYLPKKNK
ncbi:MAG: peptidoglycan DD-metalloendopeptidase family protein [Pontibacterium sp.]